MLIIKYHVDRSAVSILDDWSRSERNVTGVLAEAMASFLTFCSDYFVGGTI